LDGIDPEEIWPKLDAVVRDSFPSLREKLKIPGSSQEQPQQYAH
jgi:hypothetical protein